MSKAIDLITSRLAAEPRNRPSQAESEEQRIALPPGLDMLSAEGLKSQRRDLLDGDAAIANDLTAG